MQTLEEFLKDKTLPVTVDFEWSPKGYPVKIYFKESSCNFFHGLDCKGYLYPISGNIKENWFVTIPRKPKVKRAQYLINHEKGLPFQTRIFYKDDNECLADRPGFLRKTIKRLTETEREFDE